MRIFQRNSARGSIGSLLLNTDTEEKKSSVEELGNKTITEIKKKKTFWKQDRNEDYKKQRQSEIKR